MVALGLRGAAGRQTTRQRIGGVQVAATVGVGRVAKVSDGGADVRSIDGGDAWELRRREVPTVGGRDTNGVLDSDSMS